MKFWDSKLRLAPHRATTAHVASLYPWAGAQMLGNRGPYLGTDALSGRSAFHFDIFEAYAAGRITNTNMMILGQPGMGKSALMKTWLRRTKAVYGSDRVVAIVDVKGEYTDLAEHLGLRHVRLTPGGTTRINPLDVHESVEPDDRRRRRSTMIQALLGTVLKRSLTTSEEVGIWAAVTAIEQITEPTLADIGYLFAQPTSEMAELARRSTDELTTGLYELSMATDRILHQSFRGMFDGRSTVNLAASTNGVVIDLSATHHDREALPLVMVAASAHLQDILTSTMAAKKIQVLDESWRMVEFEATARYLQAAWKLGRTYGVGNVAVLHKPDDLASQSNEGSAASKIAHGLVADTAVRIMFAQTQRDLNRHGSLLGITEHEKDAISGLTRGQSLWKVGTHTAVLNHYLDLNSIEGALCNTDQAVTTTAVP